MISSQMRKGVLEGCILAVINENNEAYGYEISQMLEQFGFGKISEGTIYPILLRLEKNGLIKAVYIDSDAGPKRKYFHLTPEGKFSLVEFNEGWKQLSDAVDRILKVRNNE